MFAGNEEEIQLLERLGHVGSLHCLYIWQRIHKGRWQTPHLLSVEPRAHWLMTMAAVCHHLHSWTDRQCKLRPPESQPPLDQRYTLQTRLLQACWPPLLYQVLYPRFLPKANSGFSVVSSVSCVPERFITRCSYTHPTNRRDVNTRTDTLCLQVTRRGQTGHRLRVFHLCVWSRTCC